MNYSSRFWLYAPITAFLLIAAAVMAYWWVVAGAFDKNLAALKGTEAVPGITLDWTPVEVGGFPFRLDADFTGFTVKGAGAHGPFAWSPAKFALHTLSYNRAKTVYEAAGKQSVAFAMADGSTVSTTFLAASMRGGTITGNDGLRRFDLEIVGLSAQDTTITHLQFHARRDPDGKSLDLMLQGDDWNSRKLVKIYATLNQASTLMPLLAGTAGWPSAVAGWKAQGGSAKFSQASEPAFAEAALAVLY
jgi:hypothetical protein